MSKHTIIILTDSPSMSAQIISAATAIGDGEDAQKLDAQLSHLVAERGLNVQAVVEAERREARRRIHVLKFGPCTIESEGSIKLHVESRFPFHAACLKIPSELVASFVVEDLRFDTIGIESESVSRHVSANPVPAVAYSDEGTANIDLDMPCQGATLAIRNMSKRKQTFRAEIIGFRKD